MKEKHRKYLASKAKKRRGMLSSRRVERTVPSNRGWKGQPMFRPNGEVNEYLSLEYFR